MEIPKEIKQFFDAEGRLKQLPGKFGKKVKAVEWLGGFFEMDRKYAGKEVDELLEEHHTFGDPATLRRELIMNKILDRSPDGREYWKINQLD